MKLTILPSTLAVCRLAPGDAIPDWARGALVSITRTSDELSIICEEQFVPKDVHAERGWRALKVEGPIPFEVTGVAAALSAPLAEAKVSILLIATYDTDYLLVREAALERVAELLRRCGHEVA